MGKHRQRSMAYLLKNGASLSTPRMTPVLEGKARMQGPLDELPSNDDFKLQKVCRNCRNSTEGTRVQCCSICNGEYHTFCLESSIDADIQNKRLCYTCQIAAFTIKETKVIPDGEVIKQVTQETDIAMFNEDAKACEKVAEDAVKVVDKDKDNAESVGCSLPDSNPKSATGKFLDTKLNTSRKTLSDNAENANACIKVRAVTLTEEEESDRQLKYEMVSTVDHGLPKGEARDDGHLTEELPKPNGFKTERILRQANSETKAIVRSPDTFEDLQQPDSKDEKVVEEISMDQPESSFSCSEKQENRQLEGIPKIEVSVCLSVEDEKTAQMTLEAGMAKKSPNVEIKQSISLQSAPGELRRAHMLERDELIGTLEGDFQSSTTTEQNVVNRINKPSSETEKNITICIDMGKGADSHSIVQNINDVNAQTLVVEDKVKRVSDDKMIDQKDAEVLGCHVAAQEPFLSKRQSTSCGRDFISHSTTNSVLLAPSASGGTGTSVITFEAETLAAERKELECDHQGLAESVGRKVASSSPNFISLDSDSTVSSHSLFLGNMDSKPLKYVSDAFPRHMSTSNTLHLESKEVVEDDIGKSKLVEVMDPSLRQDVSVQNETWDSKSAATLKNLTEVAIEQSGDVRQLADISDHSHQQEVELQTADPNTSKLSTCSKSYLYSEDLTTRQLGDILSNKLPTDDDVKVCDICGDAGYEEMLAVCSECNEGAEHVYCMQTLMDQVPDGYWLCEGCKMKQKASGRKQFEPRTTQSLLARSSSMTYIKKQANFGNSRLRLTARLEKRKLGPGRQLKSNPLVQGPSKRQAEDAFQAPFRKLTEDTMLAPAAKKQVIEISGTSGTSQASSSSTLRPALSREGSFKNPDSGKVKFLSPSAVAGLNATAHGTSSTVRGAGKPVMVSNSLLSRTNSGQFSQQLTNRSRFVSLTSPVSDSVSGGGLASKVANNPPLNTLVSASNPMSPSLKNSFSKSSDSGPAHANLKSSFGGAKICQKSLKEALEGVAQARESLCAGQTAIGKTRILSKGDSFKSIKGAGFVSDQKSLPDNARVPPRLQNIRAAPSDTIFKNCEAKIDSQFSPLTSDGTLELKANASTFAEGASKNVQITLSDGTTELKENPSTAAITDRNGSSQAASLSNATGDLGMKNPLTVNLPSLPQSMQPMLPTPVVTHSDCMIIPKADITVHLQASPMKMGEDFLTTEICQKQRKTNMAGKETGKSTSLNENIAQQDRTHDTSGKETGKVRSLNGNIAQQERTQPPIDPLYALAGPQGEILSGSTSPVVKLEASSSMKGLGSCQIDTGTLDLTSEEKLPVSPDQSAVVEETKRNLSPISRASVTWTPSTFMPSVSTRCYKCKEFGHSAQLCASRSSSFNNSMPENSLTNMHSPLSIAPSVDISKESMQIAAAKSQNAIIPEIGNSRKVLEADVEGLPTVSNLQSQKSLTELQSHEDKAQASAFLKGPTSLGRNELEPKPKPGLPFGEAQDLTAKSCEINPSHFPTSSTLPIGASRDTSFVTPAMPFPSPFTPNRKPFGIATSVTQMPMGNIAVTGNPTVYKEASQKMPTPHHQFIPDPSYIARFGTSPVANHSVETVPRFIVPTSIASSLAETSSLALTNKGPGFWIPGAGISMHQVTTAVCTRAVAQTPNPQIDCLKSPVAEPYYLWRGAFEVISKINGINVFDGVQAHPSNRAVPKVHEVTRKLQSPLYLEELPRNSEHNCWPLQFQNCPPTSENIALYFFAKDKESYERSYRPLVDHMLKHDMALRSIVEDAELLIFPSNLLPANSQRWNQFMFLWAVFRDRKVSVSCPVGHHALSAARQTNFDASRQSNVDAKVMQRSVVPSLSEKREEKTNIDIQGSKEEKLVKTSDMAESSRALNSLWHGALPCMQTEVTTSQLVCMQSDTSSVQDASRMIQGGQQEDTINQDQQRIKAPAERNLDSSSIDLQCLAPTSQRGECKGSAITPGSGSTDQKTTLLSKPVKEGGSHVNTSTKITVNTEIQVTCTDSFQVPPKKGQSKVESPRITCQPPPASLNCPSPKKSQGDTILAVDKHRHSKSRSPGWSKDRERGLKDYPFEKGRGLERVDSSRASYRERDRDRERRYRERDREWETERAREWDRNRERERDHGRERNWEREQETGGAWGRDYGRRRDLDVVDRDHERHRHKYPYSTSRSRSPPRRRSPIKWSHSYDRYHSIHCSHSYSNSPESVHGSVRQQTPQQTDSKGRSQESHSQRGTLSADLVSNPRVEDEKIVDTKVTVEDLVEVAAEESLKDANCALKIKDEDKSSRERPIPIADLNVNPAECNLSEIEDLNDVSSTISCQPEQQGTYHTFFPSRPMELDEVEHGESSSAGKVLADQPHATQSLDLMGIQENWNTGNYSTGHSFSCRQFFPSEVGRYASPAKDEHAGQIFTNLNLALAGAKSTSSLGPEIPLVLTLLQCQPNEDTVFRGPFRLSGGACNTAEHRNLELSLAYPNMTEGMQPVIGIDMNKPASEESVNTSLSLFGRGI